MWYLYCFMHKNTKIDWAGGPYDISPNGHFPEWGHFHECTGCNRPLVTLVFFVFIGHFLVKLDALFFKQSPNVELYKNTKEKFWKKFFKTSKNQKYKKICRKNHESNVKFFKISSNSCFSGIFRGVYVFFIKKIRYAKKLVSTGGSNSRPFGSE